jgi:FkbM family methyltransferase
MAPPEIDAATALHLADLQDRSSCYEALIQRCYEAELRSGDTAVDGGAHYGMHTKPMAEAVGTAGRVHAFEPLPFVAEALRSAFKNYPNVVVHELALAEIDGPTTFHCMVDDPALSSLLKRDLGPSYIDAKTQVYPVTRVMLDRFCDLPVRFIKLDLEGYDFYALKGGRNLLTKHRPIVTMECGRLTAATPAGYGPDDFFGYASEIGYNIVDLFGRPFGKTEFALDWDVRGMPHYVVAFPIGRQDVATKLWEESYKASQTVLELSPPGISPPSQPPLP